VLKSTAVVATDAPERYAKQRLAHLGRKKTSMVRNRFVPRGFLAAARGRLGWLVPVPPLVVARVADGRVRRAPPPVAATSAVGLSECSLPAGMPIIRYYVVKEGHRGR
jgi:hypothetical protein